MMYHGSDRLINLAVGAVVVIPADWAVEAVV